MKRTLIVAALLMAGCAPAPAPEIAARPEWMTGPNWPTPVYDRVAPDLPHDLKRPAVLIFGKTNGFRDDAQIKASMAVIAEIAAKRGWGHVVTENAATFNPGDLKRFDAVVFSSTSGGIFTPEQRAAFKAWVLAGGGFVGLHGAGGDPEYAWDWYVDELIGAQFIGHTNSPQFQLGRIEVEDRTHPATREMPAAWDWQEEWYSFAASARQPGVTVLATVDEASYDPEPGHVMGADHPIIWTKCTGKARTFYSALGHKAETYADPRMQALIEGAMAWTLRVEGRGC